MPFPRSEPGRILYIQYYNPAAVPPLEHSSHMFAEAKWKVVVLGISNATDRLRFTERDGIRVRRINSSKPGWRQKLHYSYFVLWVLAWTLWWRPRWIYASDLLSCPPAFILSLVPGIRLIYHEHDSPPATATSRFMGGCMRARTRLARRSVMCILPNELRAKLFIEETAPRRTLIAWNCPLREEASLPRPSRRDDDVWVLYHGSIVPDRLPLTVIRTLALLPEAVKLRIIGYETIGYSGYVATLLKEAQNLGIESRIEFIGEVPTRSELLEWCRKSDVGLALMPKASHDFNMQNMTGASNKPFDYMACGNAVLVSDLPDWIEMFVKPGYGVACDPGDTESIAAALQSLLDDPEKRAKMGQLGRQRILDDWSYEAQFAPIFRLVEETAGDSKVASGGQPSASRA